jgi:hypothetical protein
MTDQVDVDLGLNPAGFNAGTAQMANGAVVAATALGALAVAHRTVTSELGRSIPGKQQFADFASAAANAQQAFSTLRATQAVTGQSSAKLEGQVRSLANAFPIGQSGALDMVRTLQQLGLSSQTQTSQLGSLAKGFTQLGGATGESSTGLASMQIQLSRLYGNLDPSRIMKMNDSLVTVSATAGASASAVLSFSNAIGPLAKAAGLGQTAVMGISAQMAALGQDGGGAATALNKVFSDLNQSVVDGSGQMQTYARIVNMTATQFKALYQADPTKAIENVTQALAAPGAQGQRNLEQLGFGGGGSSIRTQVALQALGQSGGLTNAINTAIGAYGNGATSKASAASFDSLISDSERLSSALGSIAESLGGPLLGASEEVTKAFIDLLKPVQAIASNPITQALIKAAGYALPAAGIAYAGAKFTGYAALGSQLFTSGSASSFRAGRAISQAGLDPNTATDAEMEAAIRSRVRGTRRQDAAVDMSDSGRRKGSRMGKSSERAFQAGLGYGTGQRSSSDAADDAAQGTLFDVGGGSGRTGGTQGTLFDTEDEKNMAARRAAALDKYGSMSGRQKASGGLGSLVRLYGSSVAEPLHNAATLPSERMPMSPFAEQGGSSARGMFTGGFRQMFSGIKNNSGDDFSSGRQAVGDSAKVLVAESGSLSTSLKTASTQVGGAALMFGKQATSTLGKALGPLAAQALPTLAIGGAIAGASYGISAYEHRNDARNQEEDQGSTGNIYSTITALNDSLGLAGQASMTFAQMTQTAAAAIASTSAVPTAKSATAVTPGDITQANALRKGSSPQTYSAHSTASQLAAQINSSSPSGIFPAQAQQYKLYLLNQLGDTPAVRSALGKINIVQPDAATVDPTTVDNASLVNAIQGGQNTDPYQRYLSTTAGRGRGHAQPPSNGATKEAIGDVVGAVGQAESAQATAYGASYGRQYQLQQINALYAQATGPKSDLTQSTLATLRNELAGSAGVHGHTTVTQADVTKYGGFIQALAATNKGFNSDLTSEQAAGISLTPGQGVKGVYSPDAVTRTLAATGSPLAQFFTNNPLTNSTGTAAAVNAAAIAPGNQVAQVAGVNALLSQGTKMGMSFQQISDSAIKLSSNLDNSSQYLATLSEALSVATGRATAVSAGEGPGAQISQEENTAAAYRYAATKDPANATSNNNTAEQSAIQAYTTENQNQIQLLTAYKNFTIQKQRSQQSYQIQSGRSAQDYGIQMAQSEQDYEETVSRSSQDFQNQQLRATQDYQVQMVRADQDYQTTRLRSVQDFNLQMTRTVQDAEKTIYDPYQRIQAAPVFDAGTLLANLKNQAQAMTQQLQNLHTIESMGLSQAAVQALSLGTSGEAQQLSQLVNDAANDPQVIAQLNASVTQRASLTKGLVENNANPDYTRQVQDFNTSLSRQSADFTLSQTRSTQDFQKSMSRQEQDFSLSMSRQAQDYTKEMTRATEAFDLAQQRAAQDYSIQMSQMQQDFQNSETQIEGSVESLNASVGKALNGQVVNFTEIQQNLFTNTLNAYKTYKQQLLAIQGSSNAVAGGADPSPADLAPVTGIGGASGGGARTGNSAVSTSVPVMQGSKQIGVTTASTYVTPGTGQVRSGVEGDIGAKSDFAPSEAYQLAHPINVEFNRSIAKGMMGRFGWGDDEWDDLVNLWNSESGWNQYADNGTSSAYGIPQALPGTKMATDGSDWDTNPATQIQWGLNYIKTTYQDPNNAWAHEVAKGWYATGSIFTGPRTIGVGEAGPEAVIPLNAMGTNVLAGAFSQALSMNDVRGLTTAAARSMGTSNPGMVSMSSNDYSQSFAGATITVVSDNADAMAAELASRQRRDALTAPRR